MIGYGEMTYNAYSGEMLYPYTPKVAVALALASTIAIEPCATRRKRWMVLIIGTERVTNKSMISVTSSTGRQRMSSRRNIMVMVKAH